MGNNNGRLSELDGLRGYAALTVFLSHAIGLYPDSAVMRALNASFLHIVWDGAAAVFLFFTLSGFVLALPFVTSGRSLDYPSFMIRRVFRLYPAFWFALGAALLMRQVFHPAAMSGLSEWARGMWQSPVTLHEFLRHMTMVLHGDTHALNPPVWSLATEMRASLVMPFFIVWLAKWRTPVSQALLLASSVLVMWLTNALGFLPVFALGIVAAGNFSGWRRAFSRLAPAARVAVWGLALALYGSAHLPGVRVPEPAVPYLVALATVLMIFLALTGTRSKRFLSGRVGIFLGETSYSFYLLHFPVLWLTVSCLLPATGSLLLCALVAVAITYLLSFCVYRMLEVPLHEAGRAISLRLRPLRKLQAVEQPE